MSVTPRTERTVTLCAAGLTVIACTFWLSYVGAQVGPIPGASLLQWFSTFVIMLAGIIPLLSVGISLRRRKQAAFLCFATVSFIGVWLTGLWLAHAAFPPALLRPSVERSTLEVRDLLFICLLLVLPGLFWFVTDRSGWSPTLVRPGSLKVKMVVLITILLMVLLGTVVMDAYSTQSTECHYVAPPSAKQRFVGQAVFTSRLIWTHPLWPSHSISQQHPEVFRKHLALGIVGKDFWGLRKLDDIVILKYSERGPHDYFHVGQTYFIDGRRASGAVSRFLPIFDLFCTRTALLADAQVDLRVIQDGPISTGIRIIGRTVRYTSDLHQQPVSGAKVVIEGPSGKTLTTSDQYGVYDVPGLPPGRYSIGRQSENGEVIWQHPSCMSHNGDQPTTAGDVRDCTVIVQ